MIEILEPLVGAELAEPMAKHFALLMKWGKRMNLTAVFDPTEAARLHYLDSLLFAELIDEDESSRTLDVGSGAGFPGIILALARPKLQMTLLEPQRKRASFLRVALAELGLDGVRVQEARIQDVSDTYDLIVSRATIPPLELAPLARARLSERGRLILSSGENAPAIEALPGHETRSERRLNGMELRILDVVRR